MRALGEDGQRAPRIRRGDDARRPGRGGGIVRHLLEPEGRGEGVGGSVGNHQIPNLFEQQDILARGAGHGGIVDGIAVIQNGLGRDEERLELFRRARGRDALGGQARQHQRTDFRRVQGDVRIDASRVGEHEGVDGGLHRGQHGAKDAAVGMPDVADRFGGADDQIGDAIRARRAGRVVDHIHGLHFQQPGQVDEVGHRLADVVAEGEQVIQVQVPLAAAVGVPVGHVGRDDQLAGGRVHAFGDEIKAEGAVAMQHGVNGDGREAGLGQRVRRAEEHGLVHREAMLEDDHGPGAGRVGNGHQERDGLDALDGGEARGGVDGKVRRDGARRRRWRDANGAARAHAAVGAQVIGQLDRADDDASHVGKQRGIETIGGGEGGHGEHAQAARGRARGGGDGEEIGGVGRRGDAVRADVRQHVADRLRLECPGERHRRGGNASARKRGEPGLRQLPERFKRGGLGVGQQGELALARGVHERRRALGEAEDAGGDQRQAVRAPNAAGEGDQIAGVALERAQGLDDQRLARGVAGGEAGRVFGGRQLPGDARDRALWRGCHLVDVHGRAGGDRGRVGRDGEGG